MDKTVFIDALEPGAKIRSNRCECIPGGKGTNVARAVKALGRTARAMVIVGGRPGQHVTDMIRDQDGVECAPVWVDSPTRTITTVLETSIHRQTAFFEPGSRVTPEEMTRAVETFKEALQGVALATFNGTVCAPSIRTLYKTLIPIAREQGVITILDAHGPEFAMGLEAKPYMAKPNAVEMEELAGYPLDTPAACWRTVDDLHKRGVTLVVLSLGKDGALVSRGGEQFHAIPPVIEEVNAVGSGDALVAGFAIGLSENQPLEDMTRLGIAAGTANAMTWDIGHFDPETVARLSAEVQIVPR